MRRSPVPVPIERRAGFAALLDRIESNGVRTVIVEDASRFARELMAQELGITLLISRGVRLLTASGDDLTASDDPTRKMMHQIAWWRAAASCHGWASACQQGQWLLTGIAECAFEFWDL